MRKKFFEGSNPYSFWNDSVYIAWIGETDCQEVNCPEGARETTLGCASDIGHWLAMTWVFDRRRNHPSGDCHGASCLARTGGFDGNGGHPSLRHRNAEPLPGAGAVGGQALTVLAKARGSSAPKKAEPATSTLAPFCRLVKAVVLLTPPSTSSSQSGLSLSI